MKMNGRQGKTVGLTSLSAFAERHPIGRNLQVGELLPEEGNLSFLCADTPKRRHAGTFPQP
jgi:hypothetical protein